MSSDPVVLRSYPSEIEADLARVVLAAEGIAAVVASHDATGLLRYVQGVQLLVRTDELEAAHEVLRTMDAPDDSSA